MLVDVAPRLLEVDVSQERVVRPAGCDEYVVDRCRQLVEEPLKVIEVRRVESGTAPSAEFERRVRPAGDSSKLEGFMSR